MKKISYAILIIVFANFLGTETISAVETKKSVPALSSKVVDVKQLVSQPKPLTLTPTPTVSTVESTYSYNPVGKSDPFVPFVEGEILTRKKAERKLIESIYPLQRTEVNLFRLVGIGGDQNRRIAMVEDATKKYYPVFIGTRIGVNNGKVVAILHDRVIIEESKVKAKRIILRLRKNQDEVNP